MIDYVLDAAVTATGSRPLVVYSPATEAVRDAVAERADAALQDDPARDRRRAARGARRRWTTRWRRSSSSRATCRSSARTCSPRCSRPVPWTTRRSRSCPWTRSIPPASAGSCATTAVRSSGSSRTRTRPTTSARSPRSTPGLYAIDAAWLRRRIGGPAALADRPASCTSRTSSRFAREDGRLVAALDVDDDGRLTGHQRPGPARARRVGHAGRDQRPLDAGRRHDDRPVHGLPRPRRGAGRRTSSSSPTSSCAGATRIGERTRIAAGLADRRLGHRPGLRGLGERHRAVHRGGPRHHRAVQPPAAGRARGPPLGDRQLRRDQEQPPRRARPPAPHQLPGRRGRGRGHERRRGHDHRQLRRRAQAPHDDRRAACSWASTRCCARP